MSMFLEFTPHSWYMGAAIQCIELDVFRKHYIRTRQYRAYIEDGMYTYSVIEDKTTKTLAECKQQIKAYYARQRERDLFNRQMIGETNV